MDVTTLAKLVLTMRHWQIEHIMNPTPISENEVIKAEAKVDRCLDRLIPNSANYGNQREGTQQRQERTQVG